MTPTRKRQYKTLALLAALGEAWLMGHHTAHTQVVERVVTKTPHPISLHMSFPRVGPPTKTVTVRPKLPASCRDLPDIADQLSGYTLDINKNVTQIGNALDGLPIASYSHDVPAVQRMAASISHPVDKFQVNADDQLYALQDLKRTMDSCKQDIAAIK